MNCNSAVPSFKKKMTKKQKTKTDVANMQANITFPLCFSFCKGIWHPGTLQHNENYIEFLKTVSHTVLSENTLSKTSNVYMLYLCCMYILIDGIFIFYANTAYKASLLMFK